MYNFENQHPEHTYADWQQEVREGNTQISYSDWVEHMIESNNPGPGTPVDASVTAEAEDVNMEDAIQRLADLDYVRKLTDGEAKCLMHLREAWEAWVNLKHEHPDAVNEFRHALHLCQYLVGMRQACRVDRDTWVQR